MLFITDDNPRKSFVARLKRKDSLLPIVFVLLIILTVVAGFFVYRNLTAEKSPEQQSKEIVAKVSKIMYLPEEDPQIVKAQNADAVNSRPFYKNVKNDDYLLIYLTESRIIIYRPSEHKIINAGPLVNDMTGQNNVGTQQ